MKKRGPKAEPSGRVLFFFVQAELLQQIPFLNGFLSAIPHFLTVSAASTLASLGQTLRRPTE
ncbi:MAG: hypothetical protein Q4E86_12780 [Lachnospiraceae bacterium]|nr:hypothetical protein [Lachnospiraceae bacterium]MDO5551422.1 hypothetical protein [Lachnospiraceae bacterium]